MGNRQAFCIFMFLGALGPSCLMHYSHINAGGFSRLAYT